MGDWKYERGGVWTEIQDPLGEWRELTEEVYHAAGFEAAQSLFGGDSLGGGFEVELARGATAGRAVGTEVRSPDRQGEWIVVVTVAGNGCFVLVDDFVALLELLRFLAPMATADVLSRLMQPPRRGGYVGEGLRAMLAVADDEARKRGLDRV